MASSISLPMKLSDQSNKRKREATEDRYSVSLNAVDEGMSSSDNSDTGSLDRTTRVQNELYKSETFSSGLPTCSRNNLDSSQVLKHKFRNMVAKLLPDCQLKNKLKNNLKNPKNGRERSNSFCFVGNNNCEDNDDVEEMEQSGSQNFNSSANNKLKLSHSDADTNFAMDTCGNDCDQDTSFDTSMLDDHTWFDDKIRNDRISLQQYIRQASLSMESKIEKFLYSLGNGIGNRRLTATAKNDLMYELHQTVGINMLQLEGNIGSIFKTKEDIVSNVRDSYTEKIGETNKFKMEIEQMYEKMLDTADSKVVEQHEQICYLERSLKDLGDL